MQWFRRKLSAAVSTALAGKSVETTRRPTALLMPLEPRVMFDGAIAASVEAAPVDPVHGAVSNVTAVHADIATVCGVDLFAEPPAAVKDTHAAYKTGSADCFGGGAQPSAGQTEPARNVVFVDARVAAADSLLSNIAPGTEVVRLDGTQDGLQQIADYLAGHPGASSVQLIAHGNDGDLWLGTTYLSSA